LAALSKQQNDAANGDAISRISCRRSDVQRHGWKQGGDVSVAKDKVLSFQNTMKAKGCK